MLIEHRFTNASRSSGASAVRSVWIGKSRPKDQPVTDLVSATPVGVVSNRTDT